MRPTFEQACSRYVHRFTMEHVPQWVELPCDNGKYYAPQFRSDQEWYDHTLFPGEKDYPFSERDKHCYTTGQTWPLGMWLDAPYRKDKRPWRVRK